MREAPQLVRQVPRPVVAGTAAAVLGLSLVAGLVMTLAGSGNGADEAGAALTVVEARPSASGSADALHAAAEFRSQERADRDRRDPVGPTTSATPTTAEAAPERTTVPPVVAKRWATSAVNVRSAPSADADRIGRLKALERVGVTGTTKSGWTQVVVGGRAGWVRSTYLAKTKPDPATSSVPAGVSGKPCSISSSIEVHLTANARAVYRAVCAQFGHTVKSFGGYRAGDPGDHGSGRAVDIMVSGAPGTQIAKYVQAHATELNVTYVIYQQHIWLAGHPFSEWKLMEDRGSTTANHYDHVHVSVE